MRWWIFSKGTTENSYYDHLLAKNLESKVLYDINDEQIGNDDSKLVSILFSILLKSGTLYKTFDNISKLIILIVCSSNIKEHPKFLLEGEEWLFKEIRYEFVNILEIERRDNINGYLKLLEKIPPLLNICPKLSNKQKLDYCNIERLLMKMYVKDIYKRHL